MQRIPSCFLHLHRHVCPVIAGVAVFLTVVFQVRADEVTEAPISPADREHWSFRPLVRPAVPASTAGNAANPIDVFIERRLREQGLATLEPADKLTLLRRVTFDLVGLPPTTDETAAFLEDSAPDAYERVVDRLMASPGFGEKWAQHWLDLARFAETDGFEHDKVRADAWKYRDWVIDALNTDLSYDRFVQLQLAGDQLEPNVGNGSDPGVATMFCLSGPDMPDINDQDERRHTLLNEMVGTVGSVFLGLSLGCAQCHDHKSDPISQADFYRLRAVFETAVPKLKRDAPYLRLKHQPDVEPARLWIRGNHRRPGPVVEPAFPRIASWKDAGDIPPPGEEPRVAFARWLVSDDNSLTARVIANRVWQHHFGRGLFATPSDVGLLNAEPTHPELLDWLATELRSHGWSLKWLHRLILTSVSYRQPSRSQSSNADWVKRRQLDPDNHLYSRANRRRLDGESLRDAMLSLAGLLSDERGGSGVMPPLPDELVATLLKGQWTTSPREADHYRRSIYLFARRNLRYPLFEAFDRPDANASCPVRDRSTTAPQSLVLFNSELSLQVARHLAGRILAESTSAERQVHSLFLRAFSRPPTKAESRNMLQFLTSERERITHEGRPDSQLALPIGSAPIADSAAAAALVEACLAVLNSSEMLYVD